MSRKQIIKCKNKFQSKDEKARSKKYTKIWAAIINQMESNKVYKK